MSEEEVKSSDEQPEKLCKGINYFKDGKDPPLLPDSEYPDWLWTMTEAQKNTDLRLSNPEHVEQWRRMNKMNRRQENETKKQQRK